MESIIERIYQEIKPMMDQYHAATNVYDRMSIRDSYNKVMTGLSDFGEIALRVFSEYKYAKDNGNELLDINESVHDKDVKPLIDTFRALGIEKFTFSATYCGAVDIAWLFQQNGCKLLGLVEINGEESLESNEHKKLHGYLFSVN